MYFSETQFSWVYCISAHLVIKNPAYLLKDVCIALEDRGTVSLCGKEQICLLSSATKIIYFSLAKVRKVCLQPTVKDLRSVTSAHCVYRILLSLSASFPWGLRGRGNVHKHKACAAYNVVSSKILSLTQKSRIFHHCE